MKKILSLSVIMVLFVLALSACFHETDIASQTPEQTVEQNEALPHDETKEKEEALKVMGETSASVETKASESSRYVSYSKSAFNAANDKKRVYYFHAIWCPSCRVINKEFTEHSDQIPEDVIVFKTDYDTETELKEKYNITYQHTFVYVDANGNEITKWNGGGLEELIANTQ